MSSVCHPTRVTTPRQPAQTTTETTDRQPSGRSRTVVRNQHTRHAARAGNRHTQDDAQTQADAPRRSDHRVTTTHARASAQLALHRQGGTHGVRVRPGDHTAEGRRSSHHPSSAELRDQRYDHLLLEAAGGFERLSAQEQHELRDLVEEFEGDEMSVAARARESARAERRRHENAETESVCRLPTSTVEATCRAALRGSLQTLGANVQGLDDAHFYQFVSARNAQFANRESAPASTPGQRFTTTLLRLTLEHNFPFPEGDIDGSRAQHHQLALRHKRRAKMLVACGRADLGITGLGSRPDPTRFDRLPTASPAAHAAFGTGDSRHLRRLASAYEEFFTYPCPARAAELLRQAMSSHWADRRTANPATGKPDLANHIVHELVLWAARHGQWQLVEEAQNHVDWRHLNLDTLVPQSTARSPSAGPAADDTASSGEAATRNTVNPATVAALAGPWARRGGLALLAHHRPDVLNSIRTWARGELEASQQRFSALGGVLAENVVDYRELEARFAEESLSDGAGRILVHMQDSVAERRSLESTRQAESSLQESLATITCFRSTPVR